MFDYIISSTDSTVRLFVFDSWSRFSASSEKFLASLLIIAFAIVGYRILTGQIQMSLGDAGYRIFIALLVFGFVTNIGDLTAFVYETFTNVPESVASFMVSSYGSKVSINQGISKIFERGLDSSAAIVQAGGVVPIGAWFLGGLIMTVSILAVAVITFLIVLSKLALGVLLGLSPFFIMLYPFQSTRQVFDGFLRQLLTFALIPVLLYGVVGLMLGIVNASSLELYRASTNSEGALPLYGTYALILIVWTLVSVQVLPWSSGIAGGISLVSNAGTIQLGAAAAANAAQRLGASAASAGRSVVDRARQIGARQRIIPTAFTRDPAARTPRAPRGRA